MKSILASELDDYLKNLKIIDDDEDNDDRGIFTGKLTRHNIDTILIKNDNYCYFQFSNCLDALYIFVDNIFDDNLNNYIEIKDKETNMSIFGINLTNINKNYMDLSGFHSPNGFCFDICKENKIRSFRNIAEEFNNKEVIVKMS